MLTFCLSLASLAYLSCRLKSRDFAQGLVAVSVVSSCHQCLRIHTPSVLGVGVGNVLVSQHVTFVIIGRWPSGKLIIVNVHMLIVVNLLAAMLASPLDQPPIPHCFRHPSQEPPHPRPFPTLSPLPQRGRGQGERRGVTILGVHVCPPLPRTTTNKERGGGGDTDRGLTGDEIALSHPPPSGGGGLLPVPVTPYT